MSIRDAAKLMAELDAGAFRVSVAGSIIDLIMDRDIAIGAAAQGLPPDTVVAEGQHLPLR